MIVVVRQGSNGKRSESNIFLLRCTLKRMAFTMMPTTPWMGRTVTIESSLRVCTMANNCKGSRQDSARSPTRGKHLPPRTYQGIGEGTWGSASSCDTCLLCGYYQQAQRYSMAGRIIALMLKHWLIDSRLFDLLNRDSRDPTTVCIIDSDFLRTEGPTCAFFDYP